MENVKRAVLLLGTNQGDRFGMLATAGQLVLELGTVRERSAIYETAAWGRELQPAFLNQAIVLETRLAPLPLLDGLQAIERRMGRVRRERWEARSMDIDILFYGRDVFSDDRLTIPHPLLAVRRFALVPLAEILGDFIHPTLQVPVRDLLANCTDPLPVVGYVRH